MLVAFLVLLYLERLRAFAPIVVGAALGFVATLSIMNVDGFIAARNLERFERTSDLDVAYLAQLSSDALPVTADWMRRADGAAPAVLTAQLACGAGILGAEPVDSSWQSFHFGRQRAWNALAGIGNHLQDHQVWMEGMVWYVADADGEESPCLGLWRD